ncbi:MAG: hypothetical protein KY455_03930 [Euryarchaeota archaeon]|nr:hypothetical protein [Euryarchaeota archaeon]
MSRARTVAALLLVGLLSVLPVTFASTPASYTYVMANPEPFYRTIPPGETWHHFVAVETGCQGPYLPDDDLVLAISVSTDVDWLELDLLTEESDFDRDRCLTGWHDRHHIGTRLVATDEAPAFATALVTMTIQPDDPDVSPALVKWQVKAGLAGGLEVTFPTEVAIDGHGIVEPGGTLHNDANGPLSVWTTVSDVPEGLIVQTPPPTVVDDEAPTSLRIHAATPGVHTFTVVHHVFSADDHGIVLEPVQTVITVTAT